MATLYKRESYWTVRLICVVIVLCTLDVNLVSGHRILVLPGISMGSHYLFTSKIGEHLANAGHDVTLLLGHHNNLGRTPKYANLFTIENYNTTFDEAMFEEMDRVFMPMVLKGQFSIQAITFLSDAMFKDCENVLQEDELFTRLDKANFDIIVMNNFVFCNILIVQKLSLPFVIVSPVRPLPQIDAWYLAIPSPPSYVPSPLSGLPDKMTFVDRLKNVLLNVFARFFFSFVVSRPYNELKQLHGIQPDIDMQTSLGKAEIVMFGVDWAIEFPRPFMPNTIFLGGLLAEEPAPLDAEFEEFVKSADDGIVVFSFGSTMNPGVDVEKAEIITAALARLPQKVVMRYKGEQPKTLGSNTKLSEWIPQNDLLGHPKTKAFVSHGGMNGLNQAVYHGVPTVAIPLAGDQVDNAIRLASKGMVVTLNMATFTSDDLYDAIKTVIDEPRFKASAMHLSGIHRDKPMSAGDTAVFWIEHVIKHGGQHLRAEALNLNFVQYFLLDVAVFLFAVVILISIICKKTISLICRQWCKGTGKKEKIN